jgi:phage antirepressor YoqD-like protein
VVAVAEFGIDWARDVLAKTGTPGDRKIQQIKDLQAASGKELGLKEAKALVEEIARDIPGDPVELQLFNGSDDITTGPTVLRWDTIDLFGVPVLAAELEYFTGIANTVVYELHPVSEFLEYSQAARAAELAGDDQTVTLNTRSQRASNRGNPMRLFVTQIGINRLENQSTKPEAVKIQRLWTDEVRPALESTGTYTVPGALPSLDLSSLDGIGQVLQAAQESYRQLLAERQRADGLLTAVKELAGPAKAWDDLVDTGTTLDVAAAAKKLRENGIDIGRTRLYAYLRSIGWVFQRTTQPMQSAVDTGYLAVDWGKTFTNQKTGEEEQGEAKSRVTPKGLAELQRRLAVRQIGGAA